MINERNYIDEIRKCIVSIESIYPTINMYDEPRERLVLKIESLIKTIYEERAGETNKHHGRQI